MHAAAAGGFVDVMEFLRQQCEGDAEAGVLARKDVSLVTLTRRCTLACPLILQSPLAVCVGVAAVTGRRDANASGGSMWQR